CARHGYGLFDHW
nr:immunoglobulin heavy chain junction region [Macaca mulatta]MOW20546.1 immunoglobulin heavy chain junction region [Macaca mulatta]MOW22105.1 immunoglobulin heavy chain junction region [Macaca mulatta]